MKSIAILLIFLSAGCGTYRPIYSNSSNVPPDSILQTIMKGNHLRLTLHDGRIVTGDYVSRTDEDKALLISSTTSGMIRQQTILLSDVALIEKLHQQPVKTAALVVSVTGVVFILGSSMSQFSYPSFSWWHN